MGWETGHEAVKEGQGRLGISVTQVCIRLGMSRQNYYQRRSQRQRRTVDENLVVSLVIAQRHWHPQMGTRKLRVKLKAELEQAGVRIGRDRLFEVLREKDLLVKRVPCEFPRTTSSYHVLPVFRNQIKDLKAMQPNEVWVGDITYLRTGEGFLYLALLTDKWSRKIVGYHCGDTLEAIGCLNALNMALAELPKGAQPIHHSDRGSQYCCHEYVNCLSAAGLAISMTEVDHCAENALAERMNGILKAEYGLGSQMGSKGLARRMVDQAVVLYNTERPHTALNYRIPAEVHSLAA